MESNPTTKSILAFYSGADRREFERKLCDQVADLVSFTSDARNSIGEYSSTATAVLREVKVADDALRHTSGGLADLKLLFPLAMVGLAMMTLPTSLQTPLWLSFLMFGFSSFESMHTGALDQPAGKSGEEHESNAAGGAAQG